MISETETPEKRARPVVVDPDRFFTAAEILQKDSKRLQELHVLSSELGSLSKKARVFQCASGPGSVALLEHDRSALKSQVKRSLDRLHRQVPAHEQQELNF